MTGKLLLLFGEGLQWRLGGLLPEAGGICWSVTTYACQTLSLHRQWCPLTSHDRGPSLSGLSLPPCTPFLSPEVEGEGNIWWPI